ncbi:MAG TPA: division/cell wall cluster transcriptional repressor MraZ [Bacilli bacterium]|jgi:protein mraZ|nr:division/cell wall cluster transcriptional repressor MraZ [Bacilli bacterium]
MLMGEYHHSLDDKKRLIIPSKLREDLGDYVIVTRGLEDCLFIYSQSAWNDIVNKLKTLPFTKKDARSFTRLFLSGATVCEFDKQGRITLKEPHTNYASLIKDCVIVGVNDRLEIWSKANWDNYFSNNKESMADVADHLFEVDL